VHYEVIPDGEHIIGSKRRHGFSIHRDAENKNEICFEARNTNTMERPVALFGFDGDYRINQQYMKLDMIRANRSQK